MKIHTTTQDLNSLVQLNQLSTNNVSSKDFRIKNHLMKGNDKRDTLSFKGKLPEIIKKVAKKADGNKNFAKMIESKRFRQVLDFMDHEVLVQAIISAIVCLLLRPLTIVGMSLFDKKSKNDNAYASTHSMASGIAGFVGTLLIAFPFSKGLQHRNFEKYANKLIKEGKDISALKENLKAMRPDIDLRTVFNEATGKVNEEKLWKTVDGRRVPNSMKDVLTVARPTHYSDCSAETFKDFGVDIDLNSQKDKQLYDMVTTDGRKVVEALKDKYMFLAIKEEGMGGSIKEAPDTNFFSLRHIDKDFLKKISPSIDIASIEKDGKRLHPTEWLNTDGTKWLNKDMAENIHLPSFRETVESTPIYTGGRRPGDDKKYASYLDNIENYRLGDVPDELGTVITKEYLEADKLVETKKKLTTWLPDIITRPLVAAGTIALIPYILKTVFGMEKKSKAANAQKQANHQQAQIKTEVVADKVNNGNNVAFKGKFGDKIGNLYAKWYANSMFFKNEKMQKIANKTSKAKGNMTEHMSVLGSLITSSVYMYRTLTNDKLDKDNRSTLAINQCLCFIIPTYAAYKINDKLGGKVKDVEYAFSGAMKGLVQKGQVSQAEYKSFVKKLPNRIKNVKTMASLATFTLVYRYFTPVVITPLANIFGRYWKQHKEAKRAEKAQEISIAPTAKEVSIKSEELKDVQKIA